MPRGTHKNHKGGRPKGSGAKHQPGASPHTYLWASLWRRGPDGDEVRHFVISHYTEHEARKLLQRQYPEWRKVLENTSPERIQYNGGGDTLTFWSDVWHD